MTEELADRKPVIDARLKTQILHQKQRTALDFATSSVLIKRIILRQHLNPPTGHSTTLRSVPCRYWRVIHARIKTAKMHPDKGGILLARLTHRSIARSQVVPLKKQSLLWTT